MSEEDINLNLESRANERDELSNGDPACYDQVLLMIAESLDDYLQQRIESDNVIVHILRDIRQSQAGIEASTRDAVQSLADLISVSRRRG